MLHHFQTTEHIAFGIRQGLALLGCEQGGQLLHVFTDELLQFQEDAGAGANGRFAPGLESLLGIADGQIHFLGRGKGHAGQHLLGGGVDHIAPLRGLGLYKLAVDQEFDAGRQYAGLRCCIHAVVSFSSVFMGMEAHPRCANLLQQYAFTHLGFA